MVVQNADEARHVGALELVRQEHEHVESRDGVLLAVRSVLDDDRMPDVLDADLVDRQFAGVCGSLHVGNRRFGGRGRFTVHGRFPGWFRIDSCGLSCLPLKEFAIASK